MITLNSKSSKVIFAAIASVIGFFVWQKAWQFVRLLGLRGLGGLFLRDLLVAIVAIVILCVVIKPGKVFSFLGLNSNIIKGCVVTVISVLPLYIVFPLIGSINQDLSISLLIKKSVSPGFIEEFLCRAFMFGLFFRYAKVGFVWATLFPAILFGLAHIYQGNDLISSFAAFGVTFLGALYFSWMYVAWGFNLWVPIGLHMLMNAAWIIFNVSGTEVAAGGLISNIIRFVSIALAIAITISYHKKRDIEYFNYPIWRL